MTAPTSAYGKAMQARSLIADRGGIPAELTTHQIQKVVEVCGDPDLAATALTMVPRPGWVRDIVPGSKGIPR